MYTKQEVEDLFNDVSDCEGHLMGYSKLQKCQALMAPGLGDDLFRAEGTPDPMICSMSLGRDANSPSPVESQVASERRCRTLSSKNWASTSCEPGLGKSGKDWICFQCDDYAHGETQWVAVDVNCRHGVFYAAYNGQIQWAFDQFRPQSQVPQ